MTTTTTATIPSRARSVAAAAQPLAPEEPAVPAGPPAGNDGIVQLDGRAMYRIVGHDRMPPFLMSIVSDSDLWMYVSSYGGLTAGRVDANRTLFPYETDDKLHRCHGLTGPITLLRVRGTEGAGRLWEPFIGPTSSRSAQRRLYKSLIGNQVVFEEVRRDLALTFRYSWSNSDEFGFIRTATVVNDDPSATAHIDLVDGLVNLLPAGINPGEQWSTSCLLDAYSYHEVDPQTGLGIIAMSALVSDRAEPAEAMRANVVWCRGLPSCETLLSTEQLGVFRAGGIVRSEPVMKGRRGAYLVASSLSLAPGQSATWYIVADVYQSQFQVERLRAFLINDPQPLRRLQASIDNGTASLTANVASADGLQATGDGTVSGHHFANVLFNNMRGGVFADNYLLPADDFAAFVRGRNLTVYRAHEQLMTSMRGDLHYGQLLRKLKETGDADLLRLGREYLPITFSRRHGDPSRPWNYFAIHVKHEDGRRILSYQGNWRDIFQNWEALSLSFPGFIESIIAKFVNASTIDGFNPYRLTREGIDWEHPSADLFSNIGYWGDHQIIYLLKLLEASRRYHPNALPGLLLEPLYTYGNVPYRIKPYESILRNCRDTIAYDAALAKAIDERVKAIGSDGKLLPDQQGGIYHANLLEKLLVPVLAKLSNLVLDGGIWMNTQRPEWNDANNALAGGGVSMVTLCYLRRHLAFLSDLLSDLGDRQAPISTEVVEWFGRIQRALADNRHLLSAPTISDRDRKRMLDVLGKAFCDYRSRVYAKGFSGQTSLGTGQVIAMCRSALEYLDHAIRANRRDDGLYHAYNLLDLSPDGGSASIGRLYEMLEGQVAALSSGLIEAEETVALLDALYASRMYRPDQRSFMLYPDRELPGFLQKNLIDPKDVQANPLLTALLEAGDQSVIGKDAFGQYRFSSQFRNVRDLQQALDHLNARGGQWATLVAAHREALLETFERTFHHRAFTGRSGAMFGYEGLGCIYWHMVAKLLVAVQECFLRAVAEKRPQAVIAALADRYYRVREGLGFNKSAREYGAFPMDPYSHTPKHSGARQPGMTGQVKEEILTRMGELGVLVDKGQVAFSPVLLRRRELLAAEQEWTYVDVEGKSQTLMLPAGSLAFTLCQVPVVYHVGDAPASVTVISANGGRVSRPGSSLDAAESEAIFGRTGQIRRIEVQVPASILMLD